MSSSLVCIESLSYTYPNTGRKVLDSIDLTLEEGQFVGLVGPAGAGKTTLALALTGLIPRTLGGSMSGSVKIAGKDSREETTPDFLYGEEGGALVGLTFQDAESQIVGLSVEEELAFALENICLPRPEIARRVDRVLALLDLEPYRHAFPHALSGGQKQRVAVAAVLALQPRLLILDEPTSELDPVGKQEIFRIVETLKREGNITVLMIEHDVEELVQYCDRMLVLHQGRIAMSGRPEEVFARANELETIGIRAPEVTQVGLVLSDRLRLGGRTLLTELELKQELGRELERIAPSA